MHEEFRYQDFFETRKGSLTKFFGTLSQNTFDGKSWYPPPLLSLTFSMPEISDTLKGSSTKFFGTVRQKIFNVESWYSLPPHPLLFINVFACRNFLKHSTKKFSTKCFDTMRQQIFDRKWWYSLPPPYPFLTIKTCDNKTFLKHRRFPLRSFSVLWDNKFSTESRDAPLSLLSLTFFDTTNFLKHRKVPLQSFSALCDKKISAKNCDILLHKGQKSVVELILVISF